MQIRYDAQRNCTNVSTVETQKRSNRTSIWELKGFKSS